MAVGEDPTFGTSSSIGKYFGIVSTIPSLVLTLWIYFLIILNPWGAGPSFDMLATFNPIDNLGRVLTFLAVALCLAIISHPIQYGIVQFLEGYWGTTKLGRALSGYRVMVYLGIQDGASTLIEAVEQQSVDPAGLAGEALRRDPHRAREVVRALITQRSADMQLARYPDDPGDTMPTRLGNVLRRYEALAGRAVGLDLARWATHLGMVADKEHTAYVQDQRQVLDLAAKMTAVGLLASTFTLVLMWPHGVWALLALVPYAVAWTSYRGAIVAANTYGQALTAWLDLNRFALYERLRASAPKDTEDERGLVVDIRRYSNGLPTYFMEYSHDPGGHSDPKP